MDPIFTRHCEDKLAIEFMKMRQQKIKEIRTELKYLLVLNQLNQ